MSYDKGTDRLTGDDLLAVGLALFIVGLLALAMLWLG